MTTGDGLLATFNAPASGVRCTTAIREAVRTLGLEIKVGLHAGEYKVSGADVVGLAFRVGARVAAKARAGEVLVSSAVKDLMSQSGVRFKDRGVHQLKGVPSGGACTGSNIERCRAKADIGLAIGSIVRLQAQGVRTKNNLALGKVRRRVRPGPASFASSNLVYFCEPTLRTRLHMSGRGPSRHLVRRNETSGVEVIAEVPHPFCDVANDQNATFAARPPIEAISCFEFSLQPIMMPGPDWSAGYQIAD